MPIFRRASFRTTELSAEELALNLSKTFEHSGGPPSGRLSRGRAPASKTPLDAWVFGGDYARTPRFLRILSFCRSMVCGLGDKPLRGCSCGAQVLALPPGKPKNRPLNQLASARAITSGMDHMVLDAATVRNLELVEPLFAGERRDATLIHVLDKTSTGMGGRLLRRRLLRPFLRPSRKSKRGLDESGGTRPTR